MKTRTEGRSPDEDLLVLVHPEDLYVDPPALPARAFQIPLVSWLAVPWPRSW